MNYIYNFKLEGLLSLFFCFFFFASCQTTRNFSVEKKDVSDVKNYYKGISISESDLLLIKDLEAFKKLDSLNLTTIPDVFIFNQQGFLIEYTTENKNECIKEPLIFLENIESKEYSINKKVDLNNYLEFFINQSGFDEKFIENRKSYTVFINTSTYTDKLNKIRFEDFKSLNTNKIRLYYVSLDVLKEWFVE